MGRTVKEVLVKHDHGQEQKALSMGILAIELLGIAACVSLIRRAYAQASGLGGLQRLESDPSFQGETKECSRLLPEKHSLFGEVVRDEKKSRKEDSYGHSRRMVAHESAWHCASKSIQLWQSAAVKSRGVCPCWQAVQAMAQSRGAVRLESGSVSSHAVKTMTKRAMAPAPRSTLDWQNLIMPTDVVSNAMLKSNICPFTLKKHSISHMSCQ